MERSYANVAATLPDTTTSEQIHIVLTQESILSQLLREGAIYVGNCVARSDSDPSMLTTAQFSVLIKEADLSANQPLSAVASALRKPGTNREIGFVDYPASEALVIGEEVTIQLPTTITGKETRNSHRVRQAQVIFPLPGKTKMAVISASSENLDDWRHYTGMLNNIAHSVSFTDPEKKTIADQLDGI